MEIDLNNLSAHSLQGLILLFLEKCDDFANKNAESYNPSIKKILTIPPQLFAIGLQAREIYRKLKRVFLQRKL